MKQKVFIIGSVKQSTKIKNIADLLSGLNNSEIRYVKKEPLKEMSELINQAYNNIEWSDIIVVVKKENGKIGDGTLYEMEYAKRIGKKIIVINSDKSVREQHISLTDNNPLNLPSTPEPEIYEETFGGFKRIN